MVLSIEGNPVVGDTNILSVLDILPKAIMNYGIISVILRVQERGTDRS